jgi:hypothetical protein
MAGTRKEKVWAMGKYHYDLVGFAAFVVFALAVGNAISLLRGEPLFLY